MLQCSCYCLSKVFDAKRDWGYAKVLRKKWTQICSNIENNWYLDARLKKGKERIKIAQGSYKNISKVPKERYIFKEQSRIRFSPPPPHIYPLHIYPHTCISWFDCMTRFFLIHCFTLQYMLCKYVCAVSTPMSST